MDIQPRTLRLVTFLASIALVLGIAQNAFAQYTGTFLVSDQTGKAKNVDPDLLNAWGIAFAPTGPFWVSDEHSGLSTLYTGTGVKQALVVTIPTASGSGKGTPTGMVFNNTHNFVITQNGISRPASFIFDTVDGTISGWNPLVNPNAAVIAVNNSSNRASYTGLAIGVSGGKTFLYAADNRNKKVDIYDSSFQFVSSFTDTSLAPSFAAYGIQNINGQLFVTFASGTKTGVVDIYDTAGNKIKTFCQGTILQEPWGLALAPTNFGPASNAILVGNVADGRINTFDAATGASLGPLKTKAGSIISISGLWALAFGAGHPMNGKTNQLFFTAGPTGYADGLFGVIKPPAAAASTEP
jgi:uncharacterized protein (TIGR03118 family)